MAEETITEAEKAAAEAKQKREAVLKTLAKDNGAPKRHSLEPAVSDFEGDPEEVKGVLGQLHAQGLVHPAANDTAAEDGVPTAHQLSYMGLQLVRELGLLEEPKPEEAPEQHQEQSPQPPQPGETQQ